MKKGVIHQHANMATIERDVEAFIAQYSSMEREALHKALRKRIKTSKDEALQKAMNEFVAQHPSASLTKLRRILTVAYASVHEEEEESSKRANREYNQFFKQHSAILKEEMPTATQPERVAEIGRRWQAAKKMEALPAADKEPTPEPSADKEPTPEPPADKEPTPEPPPAKRMTRSMRNV